MDKWATVLRYGLTYVLAPIAARKGMDALATGQLIDVVLAMILAVATAAPMIYNLVTRPSTAAMKVAVATDSVLEGKTTVQAVATPQGVPDIKIEAMPDARTSGK
jgi:hypothetical protein